MLQGLPSSFVDSDSSSASSYLVGADGLLGQPSLRMQSNLTREKTYLMIVGSKPPFAFAQEQHNATTGISKGDVFCFMIVRLIGRL